jgi:hypothetical protein
MFQQNDAATTSTLKKCLFEEWSRMTKAAFHERQYRALQTELRQKRARNASSIENLGDCLIAARVIGLLRKYLAPWWEIVLENRSSCMVARVCGELKTVEAAHRFKQELLLDRLGKVLRDCHGEWNRSVVVSEWVERVRQKRRSRTLLASIGSSRRREEAAYAFSCCYAAWLHMHEVRKLLTLQASLNKCKDQLGRHYCFQYCFEDVR